MVRLRTARVVLRRWGDGDVPAMAAINADPEVMRWIGDGTPVDLEATAAATARAERHWEEHGFGLFAVELRATGELVGFTGLNVPRTLPEIMPAVEIGWRLGREHWGQGLATEAARAALRFGFTDRGLDRIVGIHRTGNAASARVMHKLGMHLDRDTTDGRGHAIRVHALDRSRYDPET